MSLEQILDELCKWGYPSIQSFDDGTWVCTVKVFTPGDGATFKVDSGFKNPSAKVAAEVCLKRVNDLVASFTTRIQEQRPTLS